MFTMIGLTGFARSGKDSVAKRLHDRWGLAVSAFADPMRSITKAIDPIIGSTEAGSPVRYVEALAQYGYDEAKLRYPELRQFLQRLGTEAGRDLFGQDHWITMWRRMNGVHSDGEGGWIIPTPIPVVSDVRFLNEAAAIHDMGGVVVRIRRPGVVAANGHSSELELERIIPDLVVDNDGTLADLDERADALMTRLLFADAARSRSASLAQTA